MEAPTENGFPIRNDVQIEWPQIVVVVVVVAAA